jgi:hypothetical protein
MVAKGDPSGDLRLTAGFDHFPLDFGSCFHCQFKREKVMLERMV